MNSDQLKESFGTLSETINGLIEIGYIHDFNIHEESLVCSIHKATLSPEDFQIDKVYRFEGNSNPDDQSILYAISSAKFNMKGILVNGYGISWDESTSKLVEKLHTHQALKPINDESNTTIPLRTEGSNIFNAPLVEMNLLELIAQMKQEKTWINSDRNSITIFKSEIMRIVLMGLHENAELKPHKANGVISVQILEGKINFIADQQSTTLEKGQMIALHENIIHSVKALKKSFFILTLSMNNK